MTPIEKNLLANLCTKYKDAIENKKTDGSTVRMKEKAWQRLAVEFRAVSTTGIHREWCQLKHVCFCHISKLLCIVFFNQCINYDFY
jgi:Myb/SANT-like DNA-binding domain